MRDAVWWDGICAATGCGVLGCGVVHEGWLRYWWEGGGKGPVRGDMRACMRGVGGGGGD